MKATEQYFPVVLFIMLYKVDPELLCPLDWKSLSVTIQMKTIEQYFLWYCLLCCTIKVVLIFESVYEVLQ